MTRSRSDVPAAATVSTGFDVAGVLLRLTDLGPPSELRGRAPGEAARALDLDRVILSNIAGGALTVESIYVDRGQKIAESLLEGLSAREIPVEYPLIESEVVRRRRARIVRGTEGLPLGRQALGEVFSHVDYMIVPVLLDGRVIGCLHGDRQIRGRGLRDADAAAFELFALCFALVFERAVLRQRLRIQQHELHHVATWAQTRATELRDRLTSLTEDAGPSNADVTGGPFRTGDGQLRDLLTRREVEVLELMVRGDTNAAIARELVLASGTVKFHVQNILRKLNVTNRAEATSRYLRLTLGSENGVRRSPAG